MPKRILIAEDDIASREALIKLVKIRGYDAVAVANGVDLLTIINGTTIDLVITDLVMPYLDGASASDIMKLKGDTTPVIAVTGLSNHDTHHLKDKFDRIYQKPINIKEFFDYIGTLL